LRPDTVVLAGGGTGGHVFPLIAVADELRQLHARLRIVFVGTERGIESQVVPESGYQLELMELLPIRGKGVAGALRGARRAALSLPDAMRRVRSLSPKVVLSIGGYAASSVSIAARLQRIPLALIEPNSVIGWANRVVAPWVQRAYTAYPDVERFFPAGSVLRSGLPLRRGFFPRAYPRPEGRVRVLVLGGSQGAKSLNEVVPQALCRAGDRLKVTHQSGKGKDGAVRSLYERLGFDADVVPFIANMPGALADAQLVIGRAGAGAVSEMCAVGRPGILVPYPHASGDHQQSNARALAASGAAVCVPSAQATVERLHAELRRLLEAPDQLVSMAGAAQALGHAEAAEVIAQDLLQLGNVEARPGDEDGDAEGSDQPVVAPSEVH
jgi:UDP-N-acetylglucosamine--N-acetylmuramyl-(pentapeptide) pyrophosphoryl-undecaprenol N-acetylglucosamine transferase